MEEQIRGEIDSQVKLLRSTKTATIINKSQELVNCLDRGLQLQEAHRMGDETSKPELSRWQRDVKARLPAGSTFTAKAFNYAYTDAKRIRKHMLANVNYANDTSDGIEFALAVKVFALHGGVCSVWVYFGVIDTNLLD